MIEFNENPEMHEPEGWNRTPYNVVEHTHAVYRRRPSLRREDEYVG